MNTEIKRGPVQKYHFETYEIGHEIILEPLKQSSFKSLLSQFNKDKTDKHQYRYEQQKRNILATRVK